MAGDGNLDLALRMKADFSDAKAALKQAQADIKGVGDATRQANAQAASYTQTASQQVRVMQEAANAGAKQAEVLKLMGQIDPIGNKLGKLDTLTEQLNKLHKSGSIGKDDFVALGAVLTAQRDKLTGAGEAMRKFSLNSAQARLEMSRMAKDIATGNWGRLGQTGMTLAGVSGLTGALLSPGGLALGGLIASLGLLATAFVQGESEAVKFNATLVSVGGVAGVTGGQLHDMAGQLSGTTMGQAKDALLLLASTGKFTGDQLRVAGQAAVDMSTVTGQSLAASVKAITALRDDPVAAIQKLNEQFHFLDTATFQQIQRLQDMGQTQAAADLAEQTYADNMRSRAEQVDASLGMLQRDWQTLKQIASEAWDAMLGIGRQPIGNRDELAAGYDALLKQRMAMEDALANGSARAQALLLHPSLIGMSPDQLQAGIDSLDHSLENLRGGMKRLDDQSDQTATKQLATQRAISASDWADGALKGFDKVADKSKATQIVVEKMWDIISTGGKLPTGVHVSTGPSGGFAGPGFDYLVNKLAGITTPKGPVDHSAEQLAKQAAQAQDQLTQALIAQKRAVDPVTAAWMAYSVAEGKANDEAAKALAAHPAQAAAIEAIRTKQIELARVTRDAALDKIAEKDEQAWQSLLDSLRTPAEVNVDKAIAQLDVLNKRLKGGKINADEYRAKLQQVLNGALPDAPKLDFRGLVPSGIDNGGPLDYVQGQQDKEISAYQARMAELAALRQQEAINQQQYNAQAEQENQRHSAAMGQVQNAMYWGELATASSAFGQLAQVAAARYGQESKQYKVLFALSKAFAIAQAAASLAINVSKASEYGYPQNIPFIVGAFAQGAQIVSLIAGANYSGGSGGGGGYAEGGYTGAGAKHQVAGIVHAGEVVWSQQDIARAGGVGMVEAWRQGLRGYADGGFVHPLANAPSPAELGFQAPARSSVDFSKLAAANEANGGRAPAVNVDNIVVFNEEQLAERLLQTRAGHQTIVTVVGDNPRAIQGKWGR